MAASAGSGADALVAAFVAADPRYAVDPEQPTYRGGTNRCTLGTRSGEPIVFKVFTAANRQRHELACLRHFAASGLVPRVLAERDGELIVMQRLGGRDGADPALTAPQRERLSAGIGGALGALAAIPLPQPAAGYDPARHFSIIPWDAEPRSAVERYAANARRAARAIPACASEFCRRSLDRLDAAASAVARERPMLYHEDISNLRTADDGFLGFFDLEMCRVGTASMQLGVAVDLCVTGMLIWKPLLGGFATRVATPERAAIVAMGHLYHWIRICRWGWWDGDPAQEFHLREAIADAPWHLERMEAECRLLYGSVEAWSRGD